jgi:histidinol-phosphate aminotransferase
LKLHIPDHIAAITPYPPGKPIEELEREYGISGSIKLASNENPLGPSPLAIQAIAESLSGLHRYPDGSGYYLTKAIAGHLGLAPEQVVLGNGSNEIIEFLVKAFVQTGDEVITSHPSFLMYQKFVQIRGGVNHVVPLRNMTHDLDAIVGLVSDRTRLIFLDNPNNPTGTMIAAKRFDAFLARLPEQVIVVLDEAYVDFAEEEHRLDTCSLVTARDGRCAVVALRTFSKAYGLAGLRVGYCFSAAEIAACLHKVRQPFNINQLALVGARAALDDVAFYRQTLETTNAGKRMLMAGVEALGCRSYPSQTNFFLIDVGGSATVLYEAMLLKGVIVRSMQAYGFPQCIRITVGTAAENERFLAALSECLRECGYV